MNAGKSSGVRLVMTCPSTTTSASCHVAPAFTMSSLIAEKPVAFRPPRSASVEQSTHGPWQIAARIFFWACASRFWL